MKKASVSNILDSIKDIPSKKTQAGKQAVNKAITEQTVKVSEEERKKFENEKLKLEQKIKELEKKEQQRDKIQKKKITRHRHTIAINGLEEEKVVELTKRLHKEYGRSFSITEAIKVMINTFEPNSDIKKVMEEIKDSNLRGKRLN